MKLLVIITFCFCIIACKKDNKSENYPIKAKMNTSSGKSFFANFLESETNIYKSAVPQGEEIIISGIKKGGEYSLTLVILKPKVGIIDLSNNASWNGSNCNAQIPHFSSQYSSWGYGSGNITIESLSDSTVRGSFNAVCIRLNDTLRITNGSFNGKLH